MQLFKRNDFFKFLLFSIVVVFFAGHHVVTHKKTFFDSIVSQSIYPFLYCNRVVHGWYTSYTFEKKSNNELRHQVFDLEKERDVLHEKIMSMEATIGYAERTEAVRFFAQRYDMKNVQLCQVLLRRLSDVEQIFIIEGGKNHGITVDMAVVYKGNLVGKIIQVDALYSVVLLVTDARCQVSSYCLHTKTRGIFQGDNKTNKAHLQYVDRLSSVEEGDIIVSSGEGLIFPEGFCMGTIKHVEPQGIHFLIDVQPALDPEKVDYCYVVLKGELSVIQNDDLKT